MTEPPAAPRPIAPPPDPGPPDPGPPDPGPPDPGPPDPGPPDVGPFGGLAPDRLGLLVGAVAGLVVLAPVLGRGYLLSYDMVFVPRPPITAAVLGVDGSVPRAVPTDLAVDVLARVVPAWLVQQALLLAVFALAGWGAARLAAAGRPDRRLGPAAAALTYSWNPYLAERLVLGHWAFLLGYALLPWVAGSALAVRRGEAGMARPLVWLGAAAVAGSTAALLATGLAVAVLAGGRDAARRCGIVLGFAVLVNAAWWVPAVARPGGIPADPAGVAAFAAHADTRLGVLGSLLTLGGVWNPAVWPPDRGSLLLVVAALAAVATALALGLGPLLRALGPGGRGLAVAGAAALVLAGAGALPPLRPALTAVVVHVPGGGLLRDGQKLLAPYALLLALCAGAAVDRLAARPRTLAYGVLLGVLPVLTLPSLGWGAAGRLGPVHYPASWTALRAAVHAAPPGDVAALPWGLYRRFDWNADRVVLDPLPRLLTRRVLIDDDLPLSAVTVRGEDARSAAVTAGLARGGSLPDLLRAAGVRYAVVHRGQPGAAPAEAALARMLVRYRSADLLLVELTGPTAPAPRPRPWLAAGLVVVGLALLGASGAAARSARPYWLVGSRKMIG